MQEIVDEEIGQAAGAQARSVVLRMRVRQLRDRGARALRFTQMSHAEVEGH